VIDIKRLVAVELTHLGWRLVLAEYALGVAGAAGLGVLTLMGGQTTGGTLFGIYLVGVGLNYVPLFAAALALSRDDAERERPLRSDAPERPELFRKYRRQSLWILVPLAVVVAALSRRRE
jgi:hypothetical protein